MTIEDLIEEARDEAEKSGLYVQNLEQKSELSDRQKKEIAAHYIMQEFSDPGARTSLEGLGYVDIFPEEVLIKESTSMAGVSGRNVWLVLRFMMDTLRQKGVFTYPEGIRASDDFFSPRNHYGYFRKAESKACSGGYIYGFVPAENTVNKRLSLVQKLLGQQGSETESREQLSKVYDTLLRLIKAKHIEGTTVPGEGTVYTLNHKKWKMRYIGNDEAVYRCNKCGRVFSYSINGQCPEMKCDGHLDKIAAKEVQDSPYYSLLYSDPKIIPMVAREHTAQLSSQTAGEYQKDFEEGKINVLSCSTTFEMGVDVGELEATFQRNVPPETSNYIQRAGRAGRRTSSAAFSVTFARRSSHDMTFFQNPAQIIAGKINAPVLEVTNEKIAQRHLNSIVISWFFKQKPEFFEGNTKRIVSNDGQNDMAVELKNALEKHPEEVLESIHQVFSKDICLQLGVDEWRFVDELTNNEGSLSKAVEERRAEIEDLQQFRKELNS